MAVITVQSISPVYTWEWNCNDNDEMCGICRISFNGPCPQCKFPGDNCPITKGNCGHSFHNHCVNKWLDQQGSKGLCPMCRQLFTK
ncbi:anaphase promoting complex subunit 11 [Pichia kluyveri]|uniref:Anaphase-promoting complex subunit 11 n=1 Tax=Pichia kluyveri TaxID=36015 RepID=A0AAV5QYW1_PICKL|nr:anaphase promoting complex subunit 11 [Pichia kluyveri]